MSATEDTLRALIADDDDVDRERLLRLLRRGVPYAACAEAVSGAEVIREVEESQFDVIFLDYHLGDCLGVDLLDIIRNAQSGPCPIIMVTGRSNERGAVEAMRNGVYDYLSKSELSWEQIARAVEGGRAWSDLQRQLRSTQARLEHLSLFDSLTELPNRNLFFDRLDQALARQLRNGEPFALVMVDLVLFKQVNDTYGHDAGDKFLRRIGQCMSSACREQDTVARLGGDEFAAILPAVECQEGAVAAAARIAGAIAGPHMVDGLPLRGEASLGIVLCPQHGADKKTLLGRADEAMYKAKRAGAPFEVYLSKGTVVSRSVEIGNRLQDALDRNELALHYQPKVDLRSGELIGLEALLRWQSPVLGPVSPGEFIPLAERTALIHLLTKHVFTMALDQQRTWLDDGLDVSLAVNLSARALEDECLPDRVLEMLRERSLRPARLTVEITETALMDRPEVARRSLAKLSSAGVSISIDDFGVGYTSLRYLRDLVVSEIKVDKLFVSDLAVDSRDACIIRSLAELSQGFGVRLVAEGIERSETLLLLERLGCQFGQGFGIAVPMPAAEAFKWCRSAPCWRATA